MSTYKSTPVVVNRSASDIYSHFKDLTVFEQKINEIPAEQRRQIGDISFEPDAIAINTPQLGQMKFVVKERVEPTKVVFTASQSPVPLSLIAEFQPVDANTTTVTTVIDVEIPAMLRLFVGPKLQEAANKFGEMISNLAK